MLRLAARPARTLDDLGTRRGARLAALAGPRPAASAADAGLLEATRRPDVRELRPIRRRASVPQGDLRLFLARRNRAGLARRARSWPRDSFARSSTTGRPRPTRPRQCWRRPAAEPGLGPTSALPLLEERYARVPTSPSRGARSASGLPRARGLARGLCHGTGRRERGGRAPGRRRVQPGQPARSPTEPPNPGRRRPTPGVGSSRERCPERLSRTVFGRDFQNPLLLAAGTAGFGRELDGVMDLDRLGGLVTKAVSLEPRAGNPPPRVAEFRGGMLNSVGLANPGLERVRQSTCPGCDPRLRRAQVLVNVVGFTVEEYGEVVAGLEAARHRRRSSSISPVPTPAPAASSSVPTPSASVGSWPLCRTPNPAAAGRQAFAGAAGHRRHGAGGPGCGSGRRSAS